MIIKSRMSILMTLKIYRTCAVIEAQSGVSHVLAGEERARFGLDHPRRGFGRIIDAGSVVFVPLLAGRPPVRRTTCARSTFIEGSVMILVNYFLIRCASGREAAACVV